MGPSRVLGSSSHISFPLDNLVEMLDILKTDTKRPEDWDEKVGG